jgi:hypothetical protein
MITINRDSCHKLFNKLKILPFKSQYIFSLLLFVARNKDSYESNSEIHNTNTRFSFDLHTPTANLTTFQKGLFYFEIKFLITFLIGSKIHLMTQRNLNLF